MKVIFYLALAAVIANTGGYKLLDSVLNANPEDLQREPFFAVNKEREAMYYAMLKDMSADDTEERAMNIISQQAFTRFMKSDEYMGAAGGLGYAGLEGFAGLYHMNYNDDPAVVVKNIGNAIVPIISMGLALIPGVGPLISGLFSGVWSLVSSFFGAPKPPSAMEKMINDASEKILKKVDKQISDLLLNIVRGKIGRNKYVCDKYTIMSANLSTTLQAKKKLDPYLRLEIVTYMDNCDNFLKDSVESFNHFEYAKVLWMPAVTTMIARAAFLAEVLDYGHILQLPKQLLANYFQEFRDNIRRHFGLYSLGIQQRMQNIKDSNGLTAEEIEQCKSQEQIIYTNRELFPYGMPKKLYHIFAEKERFALKEHNFNIDKNQQFAHIQIFHNYLYTDVYNKKPYDDYWNQIILNCFMGPPIALLPQGKPERKVFRLDISYIPNHSYQFRAIYLTAEKEATHKFGDKDHLSSLKAKKVYPKTEFKVDKYNWVYSSFRNGDEKTNTTSVLEFEVVYLSPYCGNSVFPLNENLDYEPCMNSDKYYIREGKFVIANLGITNVVSDKKDQKRVPGGFSFNQYADTAPIYVIGIDIIIRKLIQT